MKFYTKITSKLYKKPLIYWEGKKVVVIKEFHNAYTTFSVGEELTITGKRKGFALKSSRRRSNGCTQSITQVPIYKLELIEENE